MIRSFRCRRTEALFTGGHPREFRMVEDRAQRKLAMLDAASDLRDLRVPPGNRLERLEGHRREQHSIRINDQWRICFRWTPQGPEDVEIADYH